MKHMVFFPDLKRESEINSYHYKQFMSSFADENHKNPHIFLHTHVNYVFSRRHAVTRWGTPMACLFKKHMPDDVMGKNHMRKL